MSSISKKDKKKFCEINDKIRTEEIRVRNYLLKLKLEMLTLKNQCIIDDFELDVTANVFSYNENFCRAKGVEVGDPFITGSEIGYMMTHLDDEFFNTNWNEWQWMTTGELKDLHFGYLMHCLMFHTDFGLEDILAIDDVWITIEASYQFFTQKI